MLSEKEKVDVKEKLEACMAQLEEFNDWERNFIENNSEFFEQHSVLSMKQIDVLDRLYEKIK